MRILIFHGYLLRGTGSNIYNANLARALAALGHEVHLLCQDRSWDAPGRAVTVHIPDIGRVLPVYVADTYEGFDAKTYPELTDEELDHYLAANVEAVRAAPPPDLALANHLVMGPVILARADVAPLRREDPRQRARVHGQAAPGALPALCARGHPAGAAGCWWAPTTPGTRCSRRCPTSRRCRSGPGSGRPAWTSTSSARSEPTSSGWPRRRRPRGAASRASPEVLRELDLSTDRIVSYVGKLIVSKGVDLLLAAWPLVVSRVPDARLVIVGFGTYHDALVRFVEALAARDLEALRDIAARGRELEGGPAGRAPLPERVPRHGRRRLAARRPRGGRADPLHRPARARRPPAAPARLRGAGDALDLPGVLRHGRRRGGRLRRAAAVREPLGHGRGHRDAERPRCPSTCGR